MSQHYDVVIVGGNLAAVISAALLARRGFRGLLIDQGELQSIDADLLSDLVLSEEGSAAMRHVHNELGVSDRMHKKVPVHRPMLQAIYPDQRFDWFVDPIERQREIERAFGAKTVKALNEVLGRLHHAEAETGSFIEEAGELPAHGFFSRRTSTSAMKKHGTIGRTLDAEALVADLPRELGELMVALLPFLGHFDARHSRDVTVARFARLMGRLMKGLYVLPERTALREAYLEIAGQRAFEIARTAIESLDPSGKTVVVTAARRRETITADLLIDASWDLSGVGTIPHKRQKKEVALTLQNAKPRGFLHAYGIEVDERVLPPGMADNVILLNGRRDPERADADDPDSADRAIWLSRRGGREDGRVELVAQQAVSSVRAHAEGADELEEIMRARMERLAPFLMDGRPELTSLTGRGATKSARPLLPHPFYDPTLDAELGLTGVAMRTGYKQILLAGPAVLPGLGVEGAYLSALQAADACDMLHNKKKHPKTLAARG